MNKKCAYKVCRNENWKKKSFQHSLRKKKYINYFFPPMLECLVLHFSYCWIKISFVLTFIRAICTITLGHNTSKKDKMEFTKRGILWSYSTGLEESCLRSFDVNLCMKDRSSWPRVTLKFVLFNHVFHIRCKKNQSLMAYNFILWLRDISKWKVMCCL